MSLRYTITKTSSFFCQSLIDIALEHGRCVSKSKKHHLVLQIAIAGLKRRLLFVSFPNLHLIVGISQIELGETSSPT